LDRAHSRWAPLPGLAHRAATSLTLPLLPLLVHYPTLTPTHPCRSCARSWTPSPPHLMPLPGSPLPSPPRGHGTSDTHPLPLLSLQWRKRRREVHCCPTPFHASPATKSHSLPPSQSVVVSRPLPGAGAPPSLVGFDQTPPPFPFLGEHRHFCHCASIDQCLTSLSSACCCRDSRISPSATIGLSPPSNTVALVYFRCITVAPLPCTLPSDKLLPDAFPTLPWCSSHRCGI
jgi:hypothetical protein